MKRLCILLLACCFLTACAPVTTTNDEESALPVVGFSQTGAESDWRVANSESIKRWIAPENGYELLFSDAQQKQENQIRALRTFIQQQVDYIVLAPIVETGWDTILEEARQAGIPVIITDRMVSVENQDLYTAYVGSDFCAEATKAMEWLYAYLCGQERENEEIRIVEMQGTVGSSAQLGRSKGMERVVEQYVNWSVTASLEGDFTMAKAYETMNAYLQTAQAPDVVVCQNDNMAMGVLQALDDRGISAGVDPQDVLLISFDATAAGLTACMNGQILYEAECNPLQGPYIKKILDTLEAGGTPSKHTYVRESAFSYRNVTDVLINSREY